MGGSEAMQWLGALDASFEATLARDEEIAAADLAFSLGQDVRLRDAVVRSRTGWTLLGAGGASAPVEEVGLDYLAAGDTLVPLDRAVVRSGSGPRPRVTGTRLLEVLGAACRAGSSVVVEAPGRSVAGRLTRVASDHVAIRAGDADVLLGTGAVDGLKLEGYSASRGFSG